MSFNIQKAVREKIYPKIALMAPSGGGKTYSALRISTGMAEELKTIKKSDAKILMANTEQKRGYYYADEFTYDIVDMESPHEPERYIELVNFAVAEGYDILIIDSSSHEWEGKGGCLEIHQKAGGRYQDWSKVSPRHDRFINAIAESPIVVIATMRGKDQYVMSESHNNGGNKTTKVEKIGVGAKQRDGFEYEFTCTFLLDQKTNTAEPFKDNTHIFENEPAVKLTEEHGRKIIRWANSSGVEPKNTKSVDNEELAEKTQEIIKLCEDKVKSGIKSDLLYDIIKKHNKKKSPSAIKDINIANTIIGEINNLENEVNEGE